MTHFRKIVAGLVKSDIAHFVGEAGNIFFNIETGEFRLSDGHTPGGLPLTSNSAQITVSASSPQGSEGQLWWDTANSNLYIYHSGNWVPAMATLPNNTVTESSTAPSNPAAGTLWFNTTDGNLYIFNNNAWVLANQPQANNIDLTHVSSSIIPTQNDYYDLGAADKQWRHVYIGAGTIYLGASEITDNSGNVTFNAPITVNSNSGITFGDGSTQTSAIPGNFLLPIGSKTRPGIVQAGNNVNVDVSGVISVPKGAGINAVADIPDVYTGGAGSPNLNSGSMLIYNTGAHRWETQLELNQQDLDGGEF